MSSVTRDSAETDALLDEAARGVPDAFDRLFARHRSWIMKAIRFRIEPQLGARFDDSDIVQETQLAAFRQLDDYLARRPMPFRLWLRRTAQERLRKAIDMNITWTGQLKVKKKDGTEVSVAYVANPNANTLLHTVGESYSVKKHKTDAPHWSVDGK